MNKYPKIFFFQSDNVMNSHHPRCSVIKVDGVSDTWDMVMERGAGKNIMLVPGKLFAPSDDVMQNESPYMRASYSIADVSKVARWL